MHVSQVGLVKLSLSKFKNIESKPICINDLIAKLEYLKQFNSIINDRINGKIELVTFLDGTIVMHYSKYKMSSYMGKIITSPWGEINAIDWSDFKIELDCETDIIQYSGADFEFKKRLDKFVKPILKMQEEKPDSKAKRSRHE